MGKKGFGRLTRAFIPAELAPVDPAMMTAEARLDEARRALLSRGAATALRTRTEATTASEHPGASG